MQATLLLAAALLGWGAAAEAEKLKAVRPAGTFSIVARDARTGELGVGVQSHWFSVGHGVPWAEAGTGAVATQSFIEPGYGLRGLELLKSGKPALEALNQLLSEDGGRDFRQVAFLDAQGGVAAHTGKLCIPYAGHRTGENYSAQGNLLASASVWEAMGQAFEQSEGDLAERIMVALEAGQRAGGDARGQQSAAILVVRPVAADRPWLNVLVDLRVEDHPAPLVELRRLLKLRQAYDLANEGDNFLAKQDFDRAFQAYDAALRILPRNDELIFWRAAMRMQSGREPEALADLKRAVALNPRWLKLLERIQPEHFPGAGRLLKQLR